MATLTKANADNHYEGGSDVETAVELSIQEVLDIYGDAVLAPTWVSFGTAQEGENTIGGEVKTRKREDGAIVGTSGKETAKRQVTLFESDTATLNLIRLLRRKPHAFRYALPTKDGYQMWLFRNALVTGEVTIPTKDGQDRVVGITFESSPDAGKDALVIADVADLVDQATWPASLEDAKDKAAA